MQRFLICLTFVLCGFGAAPRTVTAINVSLYLQNMLPQIKTMIGRLEERVGKVESLAVAEDERSVVQHNKLADALETIYKFMNDSEVKDVGRKIDDLIEPVRELRHEVDQLKADRETDKNCKIAGSIENLNGKHAAILETQTQLVPSND